MEAFDSIICLFLVLYLHLCARYVQHTLMASVPLQCALLGARLLHSKQGKQVKLS